MDTNQTEPERDCVRRTSRSTLERSNCCGWVWDHSRAPQAFVSVRVHSWFLPFLAIAVGASVAGAAVVIDFEQAEIGKPVTNWVEQGVVFKLAQEPKQSKAAGRVMFFPHLATNHKGILCAMATEQIPVQATFPKGASSVTLVLWGSTGCAAELEAFDKNDNSVDKAVVAVVPGRTKPGDPIPTFELTVKGPEIAYIRFSGPRTGEFLAADELRFIPLSESAD
jgi:hypothetical protein